MAELAYLQLYYSYLDAIKPLGDAERGRLFTALLEYGKTGAEPELGGNERFIFPMMQGQIDRDKEAYEKRCQTNSENGSLGGRPKKTYCFSENQPLFEKAKKAKEKEKEKEKNTPLPPKGEPVENAPKKKFVPPSVDEVRLYCDGRNNGIDAENFVDFYSSKNWMVGKNKMSDWKACVRTWEKNRRSVDKREEWPDL